MNMKITGIIVFVCLAVWVFASWFAVKSLEEPKYVVVAKNKSYEVRMYDPYITAETTVSGSYQSALNNGFRNIADYIFGNNSTNTKMAMTVPVSEVNDTSLNSEVIPMTMPVIDQGGFENRKVSFVMPSKFTLKTIPKPNSDKVVLKEVPQKKMAALKYSWYTNEERIKNKSNLLISKLKEDGVVIVGEVFSARYNPPFSIPFLLRNEVLIEIK
jgi:hypothetical protein